MKNFIFCLLLFPLVALAQTDTYTLLVNYKPNATYQYKYNIVTTVEESFNAPDSVYNFGLYTKTDGIYRLFTDTPNTDNFMLFVAYTVKDKLYADPTYGDFLFAEDSLTNKIVGGLDTKTNTMYRTQVYNNGEEVFNTVNPHKADPKVVSSSYMPMEELMQALPKKTLQKNDTLHFKGTVKYLSEFAKEDFECTYVAKLKKVKNGIAYFKVEPYVNTFNNYTITTHGSFEVDIKNQCITECKLVSILNLYEEDALYKSKLQYYFRQKETFIGGVK